MTDQPRPIGELIQCRRLDKGWTQRDLADVVGVSHQTISRIESGTREPRASMIRRLAVALGCEVGEILQ